MKSEMGFFVGNCSALFEGPLPEPAYPPAGQGLDLRRFLRVQVNGTLSMQKGIPALAEFLETFRLKMAPKQVLLFITASFKPANQRLEGYFTKQFFEFLIPEFQQEDIQVPYSTGQAAEPGEVFEEGLDGCFRESRFKL